MFSPLEEKPNILQKIGLFIVLFNGMEEMLNTQFYLVVKQTNEEHKPILDFLCSMEISKKIKILNKILGDDLTSKIYKVNDFRNQIGHGLHGVNSSGSISVSKRNPQGTGEFNKLEMEEEDLDRYINNIREISNKILEIIHKKFGIKY